MYAAAAGAAGVSALALVQPSQAEVIFTPAHQTIPISTTISIDLDDDGIADFTIENRYVSDAAHRFLSEDLLFAAGAQPGNGMFVKLGGIPLASALVENTKINSDATISSGGIMFECLRGFSTFSIGPRKNVNKRFLGLAFAINGQTHFGWARLSVSSSFNCATRAILTGFAYETEPNRPINAGQIREDTGETATEDAQTATLGRLALGAQGTNKVRNARHQVHTVWRRGGRIHVVDLLSYNDFECLLLSTQSKSFPARRGPILRRSSLGGMAGTSAGACISACPCYARGSVANPE